MTGDAPSGNVHSVGYDALSGVLVVQYYATRNGEKVPGACYRYDDVEPHHYAEMMKDDVSTGSYLHHDIINGAYRVQKQ